MKRWWSFVAAHLAGTSSLEGTRLWRILFTGTLLGLGPGVSTAVSIDAVVAADGTGDHRSVQEAIDAAPTAAVAGDRHVVLIKPGTYRERIRVSSDKRFVHLLGEDARPTVLTWDLHANVPGPDGRPIGTSRTASTHVEADDFTAENLTFENSAGPVGQALAIRLDGDRAVFRECRFLGWQDTILTNRGRHYFEECEITGHVDFVFGAGTDWFERCRIVSRRNGYITAASTPLESEFGYVFSRCSIVADGPDIRTYLGRPWRDHAAVIFLHCHMDEVVRPEGWHNWGRPERETTSRYAEYGSNGPGAEVARRVAWARALTSDEAAAITVARVLGGRDGWDPLVVPTRLVGDGADTLPPRNPNERTDFD
jgi:pectinesterase